MRGVTRLAMASKLNASVQFHSTVQPGSYLVLFVNLALDGELLEPSPAPLATRGRTAEQ